MDGQAVAAAAVREAGRTAAVADMAPAVEDTAAVVEDMAEAVEAAAADIVEDVVVEVDSAEDEEIHKVVVAVDVAVVITAIKMATLPENAPNKDRSATRSILSIIHGRGVPPY